MLHLGSSGDRQHRARAHEEPGERNLVGPGIVALCDLVKKSAGVGKLSRFKREPGYKADTLARTNVNHLFGLLDRHILGLAIRQIIMVLDGDNWHDLLRLRKLLDRDIREPNVANLTLSPHLCEFTYRDFKRDLRVRPVELVDIDALEAEASQAALQSFTQMSGASIRNPLIWPRTHQTSLSSDHQPFRIGVESPRNEPLPHPWSIGIGGI